GSDFKSDTIPAPGEPYGPPWRKQARGPQRPAPFAVRPERPTRGDIHARYLARAPDRLVLPPFPTGLTPFLRHHGAGAAGSDPCGSMLRLGGLAGRGQPDGVLQRRAGTLRVCRRCLGVAYCTAY